MLQRARDLYLRLLRDHFAACSISVSTVVVKSPNGTYTTDPEATALKAYAVADRLLAARTGGRS